MQLCRVTGLLSPQRVPRIGGARCLVVRQEDRDVGSEFVAVDSAGPAQEPSF